MYCTEIPCAFGLLCVCGRVSRGPFALEGPGCEAFMLHLPAPTAPQDLVPSAIPPSLLPPHAPALLSWAPGRPNASQSSHSLGSQGPGHVGSLKKGCSGGLGKARLTGLP